MKPTHYFSLIVVLTTASLVYADKGEDVSKKLAVLKKAAKAADDTDQAEQKEVLAQKPAVDPAEQLVDRLAYPDMSKEERIEAVNCFQKAAIKAAIEEYNTQQCKWFLNGLVEAASFSSKISPVLVSVGLKIIANDSLIKRFVNGESTQKDLEFVEEAFIVYEGFGIAERIAIATAFQDLRKKKIIQ